MTLEALEADSSRPVAAQAGVHLEHHRQALSIARRYMGDVAWGTVSVSLGSLAALGLSSYAAFAGWWPYWAAMLLNGYLLLMQFMAVHDGIHRAIGGDDPRWKWLNPALAWIGGMLTLVPYRGYDTMHMVHHRYTNDPERDPDMWCAGTNPLMLILRFLTQTPHYVYMMTIFGFWKDPKERTGYWIAASHHIFAWSLLAAGVAFGFWREVLMLWIIPTFIDVAIIGLIFNYLPHHPHVSRERYTDTAVFLLPRPIHRLVTALDMFQTYHLIHHLFPRIPFYRIGRAFDEMRPILEAEGAPIHDWSDAWSRARKRARA